MNMIKIWLFYGTLGVLAFIGLLWFCRPTESQVEKRRLTEFPKLTVAGLVDGSFARGIDTWYADTYPLREAFIRGDQGIRTLFGNRDTHFINKGEQADDIPDPDGPKPPSTGEATAPTDPEGNKDSTQGTDSTENTTVPTEPEETYPNGTVDAPGEVTGSLYITGDRAFGLYYFVRSAVDAYTDVINHTQQVLGDRVNVYCIVAPVSSGVILDQQIQDSLGASNQKNTLEYIFSRIDDGVRKVNPFDNLKKHNAEYIYFRTDHHWTALGAYYAYEIFAQQKGVEPHKLSQFQQKTYENFLGTSYASSQSAAMKSNPDSVTAYVPMGTNLMTMITANGEELLWNIIMDVDNYDAGAKYNCFSGSDQPYAYAHNKTITDGSACVVVKDSYGNAFIPFLIDHYEYVYWIDFRYYKGTLTDLVNEKGIQDVIYCTNIYNTSVMSQIDSMKRLVP